MNIETAVGNLPEIYQPIYGRPDLSLEVSRDSAQRLKIIKDIYSKITPTNGNVIRVLDLGCAQGHISFSLAELGAEVVGIDFLQENIDVCKAISDQNQNLNVQFFWGDVIFEVPKIKLGDFDLVIGLSIWHHVIHGHGLERVQELIGHLHNVSPHHITEAAVKQEPLYWAESLPENPNEIFQHNTFSREIGQVGTHLSEVSRPMIYSSNVHVLLDSGFKRIVKVQQDSHILANGVHQQSRKYFRTLDSFVKHIQLKPSMPENEAELRNEINFHKNFVDLVSKLQSPKIIESNEGNSCGYIEFELCEYENLVDIILKGNLSPKDRLIIAKNLNRTLQLLEAKGLFQRDCRAWNFLISKDFKVIPIDLGSVSEKADDVFDSGSYELSKASLISEVLTNEIHGTTEFRLLNQSLLIFLSEIALQGGISPFLQNLVLGDEFGYGHVELRWLNPVLTKARITLEAPLKTVNSLAVERDALIVERDALIVERDALIVERDAFLSSQTWRLTRSIRKLISFLAN